MSIEHQTLEANMRISLIRITYDMSRAIIEYESILWISKRECKRPFKLELAYRYIWKRSKAQGFHLLPLN